MKLLICIQAKLCSTKPELKPTEASVAFVPTTPSKTNSIDFSEKWVGKAIGKIDNDTKIIQIIRREGEVQNTLL